MSRLKKTIREQNINLIIITLNTMVFFTSPFVFIGLLGFNVTSIALIVSVFISCSILMNIISKKNKEKVEAQERRHKSGYKESTKFAVGKEYNKHKNKIGLTKARRQK